MYAERAKGKVVVLTGTCHVYVLFEQEMDIPCRRRERHRQGGGHDIFQVWVRRTSQILNPASSINPGNSTVQSHSSDWRFGCCWGRSCGLCYYHRRRVRLLRLQVSLDFEFRFYRRKAAAIKCNVTSWDDQLSLFELAFEKYGAVDIVVCILFPCCVSPRLLY